VGSSRVVSDSCVQWTTTSERRCCLRLRPCVVAALIATAAMLALGVTPAQAAFTYSFEAELTPASPFGFLDAGSVAVNDQNGRTYVADSGSSVIDVFETSSGTELAPLDGSSTPAGSIGGETIAVAANNGTGAVFVLDQAHNVIDEFDAAGSYVCQITGSATPSASECNGPAGSETPAGGFSTPRGITVDQATGEIYVLDPEHAVVDVFSVAGAYLRQISLSQVPSGFGAFTTRGVAVSDFNGHVYVSSTGGARLFEFDPSGSYLTTWTGANTPDGSFGGGFTSVAVDNESGDVFFTVTGRAVTYVFNPEGEYLTQFSHSYTGPRATAVDQASHKVYVSDDATPFEGPAVVDIFAPLVIPDVTTQAPTQVTPSSATLNGKLNPLEVALSDCHFDWGTSSAYGQSALCSPSAGEIPADSSEHAVSAQLSDLAPDTTYHYRRPRCLLHDAGRGHPRRVGHRSRRHLGHVQRHDRSQQRPHQLLLPVRKRRHGKLWHLLLCQHPRAPGPGDRRWGRRCGSPPAPARRPDPEQHLPLPRRRTQRSQSRRNRRLLRCRPDVHHPGRGRVCAARRARLGDGVSGG
jgi:hypothetical protein